MNRIQNKFGTFFNEKIFRNLFVLWVLLFPFDANLLPVSIGFMTVYPSLFLLFFLLGYSFLGKPNEPFNKADKLVILFFFIWAFYGIAWFPFVHDKKIAFYEIRVLILMASTVWLLFRTKYLFGLKSFSDILNKLSIFLFLLLTGFAFFEYFSGIHFAGKFTEKLWNIPAGNPTYSPVFLFDNPNTFLCYLFGFAILIFLTGRIAFNKWKHLSIIFILFFFSNAADSKFGRISSYLLLTVWLISYLRTVDFGKTKKYAWWAAVAAAGLVFCFATKEIYKGPYWKDSEHYLIPSIHPAKTENDKLFFYSSDSLVKQFGEKEVIKSFRDYQMRGTDWAVNIRKNLLKNGWYLTKQSRFMGVGPAQFRWYHQQKQVPYPTTTVDSPHDGLMEILSQYGILILVPFLSILFYYWLTAFRINKKISNYFILLTACYLILIIISDMSSAWLILNIGWLLIPVLLIASSQQPDET